MSDLSETIQSGRTSYYLGRNPEGRDSYVVKGRASTEGPYTWRVKLDRTTGRYFFVNDAGLGKRWRLPDYRDEEFQEQLRTVLPHQLGITPTLPSTPPSAPSPSNIGHADPEETNILETSQGWMPSYDDAEWAAAEASHRRAAQLRQAEERRAAELESEQLELQEARSRAQRVPSSVNRVPSSGFATTRVESTLERDQHPLVGRSGTGASRHYSLDDSYTVSETSKRAPSKKQPPAPVSPRQEDEVARLEREHASHVLREAERLLLASEANLSGSRGGAAATGTSRQLAQYSPSSGGEGGADVRYVAHQVASLTQVIDGLQRMLEHEREINARLTRELQERDRAIMERNLADAEAEEDDTRFKMRMLEALAAKKREADRSRSLAEEQTARRELALQQDLVRRQ